MGGWGGGVKHALLAQGMAGQAQILYVIHHVLFRTVSCVCN